MGIQCKHDCRVTPGEAEAILKHNTMNRPVRHIHVKELARYMAEGLWKNDYNPIKLATDGTLLDGQHRLKACIMSNTSFITDIRYGCDKNHFEVIDSGITRKPGDVAHIGGFDNYSLRSAAISLVYSYENGYACGSTGGVKIPKTTLLELLEKHADIIGVSGAHARAAWKGCGILPAVGLFCHYKFHEVDADMADSMFEKLGSGVGMIDGDPVHAFWRLMFNNSKAVKKMSRQAQVANLIKTWNDIRRGKTRRVSKWDVTEAFPVIL